jgi:cell division protein FtsI (penicillin-binding protein 3)
MKRSYIILHFFTLMLCVGCQPKQPFQPRSIRDAKLESVVTDVLVRQMDSTDATGGAVAVMEVSTGNIVAWVECTGRHGVQPSDSFLLRRDMEPGSLLMPVSFMVALEDNRFQVMDTVDTYSGIYPVMERFVRDHNSDKGGYGTIAAQQAVTLSSNVGMLRLIERGYGKETAAFRQGMMEVMWNNSATTQQHCAIFPDPSPSNELEQRDNLWLSLGYVAKIKPIALMGWYNAIANNGCLVRSRTVDSTGCPDVLQKHCCSKETVQRLQSVLVGVVQEGTGKLMRSETIPIAGKTGTAQIRTENGRIQKVVSFCGYFPANQPKYTCLVLIKNPRVGIPSGGKMAGTVLRKIAETINAGQY